MNIAKHALGALMGLLLLGSASQPAHAEASLFQGAPLNPASIGRLVFALKDNSEQGCWTGQEDLADYVLENVRDAGYVIKGPTEDIPADRYILGIGVWAAPVQFEQSYCYGVISIDIVRYTDIRNRLPDLIYADTTSFYARENLNEYVLQKTNELIEALSQE